MALDWKSGFDTSTLQIGKELYTNQHVESLRKTPRGFIAHVHDDKTYVVSLVLQHKRFTDGGCQCASAKRGNRCEHMAAALFTIEQNDEEVIEERSITATQPTNDDHYTYFDIRKMKHSIPVSNAQWRMAQTKVDEKQTVLKKIHTGYSNTKNDTLGSITTENHNDDETFPVEVIFSREKVESINCTCEECRRYYHSLYWSNTQHPCVHAAATLLLLEDYLKQHPLGDATDRNGRDFVESFLSGSSINHHELYPNHVLLIPRLTRTTDNTLSLSFKIGVSKMYVIKSLRDFADALNAESTMVFGTNTVFHLAMERFDKTTQKWLTFLRTLIEEETRYDHISNNHRPLPSVNLTGSKLDTFVRLMGKEGVEFVDQLSSYKNKEKLHLAHGNPSISMKIDNLFLNTFSQFHGIECSGELPLTLHGLDHHYYIDNNTLYQMDDSFYQKVQPLYQHAHNNRYAVRIGRNKMADFYYRVLPQLENTINIEETHPNKFRSFLPPQAVFTFYLDANDNNITCRIEVGYKETIYTITEDQEEQTWETTRDDRQEDYVRQITKSFLPGYFPETKEYHTNHSDDLMYEFLSEGLDKILSLGEVQATQRFKNLTVTKAVRIHVGVSVSEGLLHLDINSSNVTEEDLLDLLKHYKTTQKFYRLKSGNFIDMEDQSLAALMEMMESMHLSPKQIVSGKMDIPLYRSFYLDQLLAKNDSLYTERDEHFTNLIQDYEEKRQKHYPLCDSLKSIMRPYQEEGYQWIRTLKGLHFGGILADDMGLGKTLQMISVLYMNYLEGIRGTSLVVVPASLVFNWGEELHRFAPELKVLLISGTAQERAQMIEQYQSYDVLVTSYDLLKRDIDLYENKHFVHEIIDEAQYIKNQSTAAAKSVKIIDAKYRFALTGTPIENRLSELWSIFDYLMPGFLYSYDYFKREFEMPIAKLQDEVATQRLTKMVGPFILRRLKSQVLKELPEKLEETRFVAFDKEQQKIYDTQVANVKNMVSIQSNDEFRQSKPQLLRELMRLRQICCDPVLCYDGYPGESAKLENCIDLIKSAIDGEHRILLFSQFTSMLSIIAKRLEMEHIPYYTITGETPKQQRLQLVNNFNEGNIPVFLISLKAGGVGLNLTGADVVIHYDPWWNEAAQNQATDRAHRIGQKRKVTVFKLIAKNTIEEKIQQLQQSKHDLADQIINGESVSIGNLSKDDFLDLLN